MEISQLGLFSLLIHAAVVGAIVGMIRDVMSAVCMSLRLWLSPASLTDSKEWLKKRLLNVRQRRTCTAARVLCGLTVALIDILFVVVAALALIIVAYACNSGRMRWMLIVGFAIGFLGYRVTVGRPIRRFFSIATIAVFRVVSGTIGLIRAPLAIIKNKLKCILSKRKSKEKGGLRCEEK